MRYGQTIFIFNVLIAVEELTCLATWKDGNSRYLVGLVSHHHATSNEERYRCFVYEKISPLGKLPFENIIFTCIYIYRKGLYATHF